MSLKEKLLALLSEEDEPETTDPEPEAQDEPEEETQAAEPEGTESNEPGLQQQIQALTDKIAALEAKPQPKPAGTGGVRTRPSNRNATPDIGKMTIEEQAKYYREQVVPADEAGREI